MAATENAEGREPDRTIHLDGREKGEYLRLIQSLNRAMPLIEDPGAHTSPPSMVSLNDLQLEPPGPLTLVGHARDVLATAVARRAGAKAMLRAAEDEVRAAEVAYQEARNLADEAATALGLREPW